MKKAAKVLTATLAVTVALSNVSAFACTGLYVGKQASADGTTIIARSEDISPSDYQKLHTVVPRVENQPGRVLEDINGFQMPLPATTYQYTTMCDYADAGDGVYPAVCSNEMGVSVTGTVSASPCAQWKEADPYVEDGLREAVLPAAVACCSATAKEGVENLLELVDTYGSAEGNIVLIADQSEAWIVEIYGGHQYAAMKMPKDAVAVFGNQFMIGCVDPEDTEHYILSDGLLSTIDALELAVLENGQYNLAKSVTDESRSDSSNMRTWIGHKLLAPSTVGDYDTDTFYELFYTPDEKVTLDDVMAVYRSRYEGTAYDADQAGNEGVRPIAVSTTPETHIIQIHDDYPTQSAAVTWLAPGGAEHAVFLPEFSGITDTAAAWKTDSALYTEDSVYWTFKKICGLADTDRTLYTQGVEDYWLLQEAMMQAEMEAAGETVKALYAQDETQAAAYVTALAQQMVEEQMANADHLYAELLTTVIHNNGLSSGKTPTVFEATAALRDAAEFKGYTVGWDTASGSITLTKGADTISLQPGSTSAVKNGAELTLSTAPYAVDGVTYVPMSFLQSL
ncbi:C69 family dipeptidase [uncultured Flavonifractor sp.]|uniref:C69 family dipeptidase n=1 Tax=uncultured Flavonifractor sp. TaxID=1193534 RepID=UPI002594E805|nr:C69 family dipeptidase [uncultured Flavonifractor sp.]